MVMKKLHTALLSLSVLLVVSCKKEEENVWFPEGLLCLNGARNESGMIAFKKRQCNHVPHV